MILDEEYFPNEPFIFIFKLGIGNDNALKKIIDYCLSNYMVKGFILQVDNEQKNMERFFFLESFIMLLLNNNKRVGIWGVPLCVPRTMFSPYVFMRFLEKKIEENILDKNHRDNIFLSDCVDCIDRSTCRGFRDIDLKKFKPLIKYKNINLVAELEKNIFDKNAKYLNNKHNLFLEHCNINSSTTDRYLYYVQNIDFNSEHSYNNRFVYSCDFLRDNEYENEFKFINENAINKDFVFKIKSIVTVSNMEQLVYSLAEKNGKYRETFYIYRPDITSSNLLDDFKINFKVPNQNFFSFIGIGFDSIDHNIMGYKIYYKVTKNYMISYLKSLGIEGKDLSLQKHYIVFRLNNNQNLVSHKIEIRIRNEDFKHFKSLLNHFDYYNSQFTNLHIFNITLEIKDKKISKINLYHKNHLSGKEKNAI